MNIPYERTVLVIPLASNQELLTSIEPMPTDKRRMSAGSAKDLREMSVCLPRDYRDLTEEIPMSYRDVSEGYRDLSVDIDGVGLL